MALKDERDRVLSMVEAGQLSAAEAAQLLDTLETELEPTERTAGRAGRGERRRDRVLRIRATSLGPRSQPQNISAALPVSLIRLALRLGARLVPMLSESALEDLLYSIEQGAGGRVLDLQDLEKGERLEIFVE